MAKYQYTDIFDASVYEGIKKINQEILEIEKRLKSLSEIKIESKGGQNLKKINENISVLNQQEKKLNNVKKEQTQVNKKLTADEKKLNVEYVTSRIELQKKSKELKDQIKLDKDLERLEKKEIKTLKDMQFALSTLNRKRKTLNLENKEEFNEYQRLTGEIAKYNQKLKQADYTVGMFQRNVGNYPFPRFAKGFKQVGAAVKGVGASFGAVALAATAIIGAVRGAYNVVSGFIEAAKKQYEAEKKLKTILKERTNATNAQYKELLKLTAAQQKSGILGDEIQIAGLQQLATFTTSTEQLKKLLPAMNNLIAQQKGFNATQQDAVTVANLIGKVLDGQVGALTRVGISLTDSQKKMIKYGDKTQRAAILTEIITNNVGNMNQALAQTDMGKIQQAKNTIGDLKEEVGKELMPVIADIMKLFAKAFNFVIPAIKNFIRVIKDVASDIFVQKKNVKELKDAQAEYADVQDQVTKKIATEKTTINNLLIVAKNDKRSKQERFKAIKQLNAISPEYLGNITLENINTKSVTESISKYIEALKQKATAQLIEAKTQKFQQNILAGQISIEENRLKYEQNADLTYKYQIEQAAKTADGLLELQKQYAATGDIAGLNAVKQYQLFKTSNNIIQKDIDDNQSKLDAFMVTIKKMGLTPPTPTPPTPTPPTTPTNTPSTDELTAFQQKQAIDLAKMKIKLEKQYVGDTERIDTELLLFKKKQNGDLINFLSDKQKKYQKQYLDAQYQSFAIIKQLNDKKKQQNKEDFDNEIALEQANNRAIILLMQKEGKKAIDIKRTEIEQKIEIQKKYLAFLQNNSGSDVEIQKTKNSILEFENQLNKLNQGTIETSQNIFQRLSVFFSSKYFSAFQNAINSAFSYIKAKYNEQIQLIDAQIQKHQDLRNQYKEDASQLQEKLDDEIKSIEKRKQAGLAYDTTRMKELQNEIDRKKKLEKFEQEQAKRALLQKKEYEKRKQRMDIIAATISTAKAVVEALAEPPAPNFILGALAAAAGAFQIATIKTQKFARGAEYVDLNGNKKGIDTVPAFLNEGERVLTTAQNSQIPKSIKNEMIPKIIKDYILINNILGTKKEKETENLSQYLEKIVKNTEKERITYNANGEVVSETNGNITINYK